MVGKKSKGLWHLKKAILGYSAYKTTYGRVVSSHWFKTKAEAEEYIRKAKKEK